MLSNSLKMKKQLLLSLLFALAAESVFAQISFVKKTNLLTPANHFSGVAIAVLDMNGDGLDDIARMNQGFQLAIEYQTAPNQPFTHLPVGNLPADGSQWGMCAADVDNNGFPDVLAGGDEDEVKLAMANADGSAFSVEILNAPVTFTQCVNFADINNDGWLDAFVCHDDGASRIFGNDGAGNLTYQPSWINLATYPSSDNSGNYGSVWSDVDNDGDLDLYIAKCRQGVSDPSDPRRINQLFLNNPAPNGGSTYTQDTANTSGLRIGAQSWTADFGDIDNDGDFDCFITNHDVSNQLLENDGAGHFTDISATAGISDNVNFSIQGVFRDFDNDGFVDILVAGTEHFLLRNNGNKTFSLVQNLFDNNPIESFAIGDLNDDGFQDIYAGYAGIFTDPSNIPDALWMNAGNSNNFFGLNLRGTQSNRNAVGAKVVLHSALGTQVREVRSGESYGIMNSMQIHFGMRQAAAIDSVVIFWPSGTVDVLKQPLGLNQYITVQEGGCIVPQVTLVADGPTTICTGQSVELATTDAFVSYHWNTGAVTPSITVQAAGNYVVTVTTSDGCAVVSNSIAVVIDPVEIPLITASGDSTICEGSSVVLTASPASAWMWNNGATTQSITVTQPGTYTVTAQGLCAQFISAPLNVTVLANPLPVATNDTIAPNQTATLAVTGSQVSWYDAPIGGDLLFTGNSFTTPPLDESTTYWVSNAIVYDEPNVHTGMTDHQGNQFGDFNFNGAIIFDCLRPFRLAKVKVYANTASVRKIDLRDAAGNVLQSKSINIPAGTTVISVDFDIPLGIDLSLTTDEAVNFANLGSAGPQLRRSTQNVTYPYVVPNVVSLKNSNFGELRYFYFFDWEIDFYSYDCVTERVPVTAVVIPAVSVPNLPAWAAGLRVFPNPTSGILDVEIENYDGGEIFVSIKNTQGVILQNDFLKGNTGKMTFRSDLSPLPKGVYWLELAGEKGVLRRRVIVQ
jgi:hypothetical protein